MTELALVAALAKRLPLIGDDCAIVRHGDEDLLFTTDLLVEDVHFRRPNTPRPTSAIAPSPDRSPTSPLWEATPAGPPSHSPCPPGPLNAGSPPSTAACTGLAARHDTEITGGDFSRAPVLVADVMICGTVPPGRAYSRSGARPGDASTSPAPWEKANGASSPASRSEDSSDLLAPPPAWT